MKTNNSLLFFTGFAIFCLYVSSFTVYAKDNSPAKPLIKIVKPIYFGLPIDCTVGENCWVMNYVDMPPDDNKSTDIACYNRTYDGHKGTDIAILDEATMKAGVDVLAAQDGIIKKVRDGEPDQWSSKEELEIIKQNRKECGNAIMIEHENNYQTIYCHLKKNSIRVKAEQKIKKGDIIGQVGLSGFTEFPHIHFGIVDNNHIIDPFTGQANTEKCGEKKHSLWDQDLALSYDPIVIYAAGFSTQLPNLENLDRDGSSPEKIKPEAELLSFWASFFGVRQGDIITLEIKDPNGKEFVTRNIEQPVTRARQFYFTGKKLYGKPLSEGAYTGHVTISRVIKNNAPMKWEKTIAVLVTN